LLADSSPRRPGKSQNRRPHSTPRLRNPGDVKPVGEGISELRIDVGAGYRIYFVQRGTMLIVLLCGGDKATQNKDIAAAKRLAKEIQ
jgi:putative addiction module killer protein